jgi:hypothetical protein
MQHQITKFYQKAVTCLGGLAFVRETVDASRQLCLTAATDVKLSAVIVMTTA